MKTRYVKNKIKIIDGYISAQGGFKAVKSGMAWVIRADKLRFKYGSSFDDLKIPAVIGSDDEKIIVDALMSIAALLCARYELKGPSDGYVRSTSKGGFNFNLGGHLKEKTYKIGVLSPGSLEVRAAEDIVRSSPYVDGSMVTLWLGKGSHGNKFAYWFKDLLLKSLKEGKDSDSDEDTAHIALLHTVSLIIKHKEKLKTLSFKGVSYDMLDAASTFMVTSLMESTIRFVYGKLKVDHSPLYDKHNELLLSSMVNHKSLMMVKSNMFSAPHNPYGLDSATIDILKPFLSKFGDLENGFLSVEACAESICDKILKDPKAGLKLDFKQKEMTLRCLAVRYLARFDSASEDVHRDMARLVEDDKYSMQLVSDTKMFGKFESDLISLRSRYDKDKLRVENLDYIINVLDFMKKPKRKTLFSTPKEQQNYILHVIEAYICYLYDEQAAGVFEKMSKFVVDRRIEVDMELVINEYKKSKLYRISSDDQLILKHNTEKVSFEANLFIDIKDFIVDIQEYKGTDMSDFIKENLYKPINEIVGVPSTMPSDDKEMASVSLSTFSLGAVIMSGPISSLLDRVWSFKEVLSSFTKKMSSKIGREDVSESIYKIHAKFLDKKRDLYLQKIELGKMVGRATANINDIMMIETQERRIDNLYRNALEETLREQSSSGMCISFGKSAEVLTMETVDGHHKFSIGEKVREASLGTLRDPAIRAEMEMHYQIEKIRRQKPELIYPYDVYFGKVYNVRIPQDIYKATEDYIDRQEGEREFAEKLGKSVASEFSKDVQMLASGKSHLACSTVSILTDMYNNGVVLSEDAVSEYIRSTNGKVFFFKKNIRIEEFSERIKSTFYLPTKVIALTIGVGTESGKEDIHIFVRHGVISFKGSGRPVSMVVHEFLRHDSDFYQSVMMDHVSDWYSEEKKKADAKSTLTIS